MKYLKVVFSHFAIVSLSIIFQILVLVILLERLNEYSIYISLVLTFLAILISFHILNRRMNPDFKIPWLMIVLGLPLVGIVLYFLFSKNYLPLKQQRLVKEIRKKNQKYINLSLDEEKENKEILKDYYGQNKYIDKASSSKGYKDTRVTYFKMGEEFYLDLLNELMKAKKYIFLEYFIIEEGEMFNSILAILKKK